MSFAQAVAFVLRSDIEGEWANDPQDPGGRTRWGISSRAHPDVNLDDLTQDGAAELYWTWYWTPARCEVLPSPLGIAVFDGAVQHGVVRSVKLLQDALGLIRDGIIGPQTLTAATGLPWGDVLIRLLAYRLRFYQGLQHQATYGMGWTIRVLSLQRYIYETQGGTP